MKLSVDTSIKIYYIKVLSHPTNQAAIPEDIDIAPTLLDYSYKNTSPVDIHISNVTTKTVVIPPRGILCEIQPVTIEHDTEMNQEESNIFDYINIDTSTVSEDQHSQLFEMIKKYEDIFSKSNTDIGHYTKVKHQIHLSNETPFKQRHRRIPPAMLSEVRNHLQDLLAADIIRPSCSQYASNIVIAREKGNSLRMCIDFRELNKRTIRDSYAIPRIEEILDSLSSAKYFTVLDMKSGYHQIEKEESHKARTAFTVGPLEFWEFNRLPFGLNNSPATYQRVRENSLGDLHTTICFIYLDDLIIYSDTFEEHLERLEKVFEHL